MARPDEGRRPGVMERIAVLSVALSMALMIISLAVVMGFKEEVAEKMTGFTAHVTLCDIRGIHTPDSRPVKASAHIEELASSGEGFVSLSRYALRGGILRTKDAVEGVMLKGVGPDFDRRRFEEWLVEGRFPEVGDSVRNKDILLSQILARRLNLGVGDKVEMLFVETDAAPRRDRFKIAGIYSSGMDEMDNRMILTDIRNVQRLCGWNGEWVSGYEIFLDDLSHAARYAAGLDRALLYDDDPDTANLAVNSLEELYPNIFGWLRAHDVNAAVIIVIMLVVALFNMTSVLLILVLESTRTIGLFKTLGMSNGVLRRIFLYRSAFIALKGMLWGNGVALALCLSEQHFHWVRLDAEGYMLSQLPLSLDAGWMLALNVGALAVIVSLLVVPSYIISKIKPEETIRYE